ncbi:hypothetical protein NDU88_003584 [Pleurodeles waltl]|uniref:Uncharacterized protein n=1 Tax=Pleurodeles waltl TaxID=8319 RepID=A0AAV7UFK9_PLEWA|nr:hypothetical protein NDU88_003584 [Pleurodeles waltl]
MAIRCAAALQRTCRMGATGPKSTGSRRISRAGHGYFGELCVAEQVERQDLTRQGDQYSLRQAPCFLSLKQSHLR